MSEGLKLFLLAARAVKNIPTGYVTNVMAGYRLIENEDAAKGSFVSFVLDEKRDAQIDSLLCLEIPADVIRMAYAALPPEAAAKTGKDTPETGGDDIPTSTWTVFPDDGDGRIAARVGEFNEFLISPFQARELAASVRKAVEHLKAGSVNRPLGSTDLRILNHLISDEHALYFDFDNRGRAELMTVEQALAYADALDEAADAADRRPA